MDQVRCDARLREKFGLRRCVGLGAGLSLHSPSRAHSASDFGPHSTPDLGFASLPDSAIGQCAGAASVALYRSRELSEATQEDVDALQALGITRIYDLRKLAERSVTPEPDIISQAFEVQTCPVDMQDDENRTRATMAPDVKAAYGKPGERMVDLYAVMASHGDAIRDIVCSIAASKTPVLVHCANGKDRAGIVCASMQLRCGVAWDAVLEDYLTTNACNATMNQRDLRRFAGIMQPEEVAVLAAMFEAREAYLATFFSQIEERHGSVRLWLS